MASITCQQCGGTFSRPDNSRRANRFCSRECYYESKRFRGSCATCGKDFVAKPTELVFRGLFCSLTCKKANPEPRFWSYVDLRGEDECWEWTGGLDRYGYGRFPVSSGKAIAATRFSYELANGPSDRTRLICHTCDNPPCVNPAHLFLGSHKENSEDMVRKGRSTRGERNGQARLTVQAVDDLRRRYAAGGITQQALADEYGVGISTVNHAIRGIRWNESSVPPVRTRR